jgi:hypothetical protein
VATFYTSPKSHACFEALSIFTREKRLKFQSPAEYFPLARTDLHKRLLSLREASSTLSTGMVQFLVEMVEISPVEMLVALNAAIVPFCQLCRINEKDAVSREAH